MVLLHIVLGLLFFLYSTNKFFGIKETPHYWFVM